MNKSGLRFGVAIVGPPGCGKTTFALALHQFCAAINRKSALVNLDPANENLPSDANFEIDVQELVRVEDVMKSYKVGPNGGLVTAVQFLEKHFDWLSLKFEELSVKQKPPYFYILDLPGQAELYISHTSVKSILKRLQKELHFQFCAVHLIESRFTLDLQEFVSATFLTLSAMMNMEMPFISLLSKIDLLPALGKPALPFQDLLHFDHIKVQTGYQSPFLSMTQSLLDTIDAYQLVNYSPLNIQSKECMSHVLAIIDKALGYVAMEDEKLDTSEYLEIESELVDKIEEDL